MRGEGEGGPSASMRTVLLDLGGVMTPDPWETLMLTPHRGLAARVGVDPELMKSAGEEQWPLYATDPDGQEHDWWAGVEARTGTRLKKALVAQVEAELLRPAPGALELLQDPAGDFAVGVTSNNTAFWYPKQVRLLRMTVTPEWRWLSHEREHDKAGGLFETAANELTDRGVHPATVTIVEDRTSNETLARSAGFNVHLHQAGTEVRGLGEEVRRRRRAPGAEKEPRH